MILRTTGEDMADQAITGNYLGTPYSKLDCQGFVEEVLKDLGVRKPDGSVYNWKGSNSMYRNFIRWRGTVDECKKKFGCIPQGAFMFIVKRDGGEKEKGYNDDLGNASHVGLHLGAGTCMDSQPSRGVAYVGTNIFTHVGLMDMIDYYTEPTPPDEPKDKEALKAVATIRNPASSDSDCLEALKILTNYLKEDTL